MEKNVNRRDALKLAGSLGVIPFLPNLSVEEPKTTQSFFEAFWSPRPLEIPTPDQKLCVLLDNQRKFNESCLIDNPLKDYSIPIITKLFDEMVSHKLFGFQPILGESGLVYYFDMRKTKKYGYSCPEEYSLCLDSKGVNCERNKSKLKLSIKNRIDFNATPPELTSELAKLIWKEIELANSYIEIAASELAAEIDMKNITEVFKNPGTKMYWDFNTCDGYTCKEKFESLHVKLCEASNVIHRKTLRGGANWMVVSTDMAYFFEGHPYLDFKPSKPSNNANLGATIFAGTIDNRWKLYKNPLISSNKILLGYQGEDSCVDSGYIYSPHLMFSDYSSDYVIRNEASCFSPSGRNHYAVIEIDNWVF